MLSAQTVQMSAYNSERRRLEDIADINGFVDVEYLAEHWSVGIWCVRKFIEAKSLPAYKIGRRLRINARDALWFQMRQKLST